MLSSLKRVLIGSPLRTEDLAHERLSNFKALAVFSSDALSSVAYATEEVLLMLVAAGSGALSLGLPVGLCIAALLVVVALSYRQTIFAYPGGGGAYIVAKENLGTWAGLIAGSALLIDYVLTVAVSIAAGVAAVTSAFEGLAPYRVELCLAAILLVTLANLRGVRESGSIFAAPTYAFVFSMAGLIGVGFFRLIFTGLPPVPPAHAVPVTQELTLFLILRAFASGCTALSGVEAISNGVQAFREPTSNNAAKTLTWMAGILMAMFLGITVLTHAVGIHPEHNGETVLSQLAHAVVGNGWFYYVIQAATALILMLAANTSYADFPRLASLIARDGFLPRQLALRGDRLVFSNGIVTLGVLASALTIHYGGETHALIPLYAVGVFLSFTLSQSGMVIHWIKEKAHDKHWLTHALVNGFGALVTGVVLIVTGVTKFIYGAWIIIVLIPCIVLAFRAIRAHYDEVAASLRMPLDEPLPKVKHTIVIPVAGVNRAVAQTIAYAMTLTDDVRVVHVATDPEAAAKIKAKWAEWNPGVALIVIQSPYRSVMGPFLDYVKRVERRHKNDMVTVIIPEFVPRRWWHHLLHNQSALILRTALHFRPHTVVVSVPYHLSA
ncbi:MAG TPA: APC family permease [Symbiobacteriaceae bacterium]|jgi:amino acid transporter|nr:APC family permease [Symbiobacteriaceae bacterium]